MIDDSRLFRGKYSFADFSKAVLQDMLRGTKDRDLTIAYWKLDEVQEDIHAHFDCFFRHPERHAHLPSDEVAFKAGVSSASFEQDLSFDPDMVK